MRPVALLLTAVFGLVGCGAKLDAGSDRPHGALPVDERSPIVIVNDGPFDNWQGEYATVLAATGRIQLAGIIVNSSVIYPSLDDNVTGFRALITAARDSGMQHLPDPIASVAPPLERPESGEIADTVPNRSEGAHFIVDAARRLSTPAHPLAVATGDPVTDLADAYLLDPSVADRIVVLASLGTNDASGAHPSSPNGNYDEWATTIVSTKLRFVQVNGYYDQTQDLPEARVAELPQNAFGKWMANKRPQILDLLSACDQISLLAVAWPWFASDVTRMRAEAADKVPLLVPDASGSDWLVARGDGARANAELWSALKNPATFR